MRINISYHNSLTFEQFKEQFEKHFSLTNPVKKEAEMKKAWEKAEARIKSKEEKPAEQSVVEQKVIEAAIPLNESGDVAHASEDQPVKVEEEQPRRRKG
jgi:hypothetical protein